MPIREFDDANGVRWRVWSTVPFTTGVVGAMRQGWLTFERSGERRRLMPIPSAWEEATDETLRELCRRAEVVGQTPRTGSWRIEPRE